jgi:methylenetetrahydrofolate dehydrogenase (NADP+)/methenyltetrahydrofolate cyclohydrolase
MPVLILSGKEAAEVLLEQLKPKVKELDPKLVIVQVGEDAASASYIKKKLELCTRVGMRSEHRHLRANTSLEELLGVIDSLNHDLEVSGFIVQLPLPHHLRAHIGSIVHAIDPRKDVDGFCDRNMGHLFLSQEEECLAPATPSGIIALLHHYDIPVAGKHVVIVGRSNIVGKPLAVMLLTRDATVTICHRKTLHVERYTLQADILLSAAGKPRMITANMVKPGAVVVDVGITRMDGKLIGDVDFEAVKEVSSAITPVPGGVGPMTVACLIKNCVRAKELQITAAANPLKN